MRVPAGGLTTKGITMLHMVAGGKFFAQTLNSCKKPE